MIFRKHVTVWFKKLTFTSRSSGFFLCNSNSLVNRDIERSKLDGLLAAEFYFLENSCGCGCAKVNDVRTIEAVVRRCSSK